MAAICGSAEVAKELKRNYVMCIKEYCDALINARQITDELRQCSSDEETDEIVEIVDYMKRHMDVMMPGLKKSLERLDEYISIIEDIYIYTPGAIALISTQNNKEVLKKTDSGFLFDSPDELGKKLNTSQGSTTGLCGSCGVCSCENVLLALGFNVTEGEVFRKARTSGSNPFCSNQGGTSLDGNSWPAILSAFGVRIAQSDQTIENITGAILSGRLAIVGVDAKYLHPYGGRAGRIKNFFRRHKYHALTVTSVELDESGKPVSIIVCDSNADALGESGAMRYPVKEFEKALMSCCKMTVTEPFR